jgi:hypothetical protein
MIVVMSAVDPDIMIEHMKERGISDETFNILEYSSHDINSWLRDVKVMHNLSTIPNVLLTEQKQLLYFCYS